MKYIMLTMRQMQLFQSELWHLSLSLIQFQKSKHWMYMLKKSVESVVFYIYWLCFSVCHLAQDGLVVQINSTVGGERGLDVSLLFHLHPRYPSCPPDISVSSTGLSKSQCHNIRQKLLDQAAVLPPEPMIHQLVEWLQVNNWLAGYGTHANLAGNM